MYSKIYCRQPPPPGTAADMWSYGCLLAEVLTGRKLFQAGDKLASVLRPAQLLEMKLGDTEAVWAEQGCGDMFSEVKVSPEIIGHFYKRRGFWIFGRSVHDVTN